MAYGDSQARGRFGAVAASHSHSHSHSHSNADPCLVCDLHCTSQHCWIPDQARDGTHILMDTNRIHFYCNESQQELREMWTSCFEGCVEVQRVKREKGFLERGLSTHKGQEGGNLSFFRDLESGLIWLKCRLMVRHDGNQILAGGLVCWAKAFRVHILSNRKPLKILEQGAGIFRKR